MNRRRFLYTIVAAVAFAGAALQPLAFAGAGRPDGPAMWRVTGDSGTAYLFGSFHILPPEMKWRNDRTERAYASSQHLVTEVAMDAAADPVQAAKMRIQMALPPNELLEDYVSSDTYQRVVDLAADLEIPMVSLARMRPWAAGMVLTVSYMSKNGFDPEAGADRCFRARAVEDGKSLGALESIEQQIEALASLSKVDGEVMIKDMLRFLGDVDGALSETLEAWRTGDTAKLEKLSIADLKRFPSAYEALLVRRNRNWLPQIEAFLKSGKTYFVVVGAAHLVGEDSVVAMLRKRGYTVERY